MLDNISESTVPYQPTAAWLRKQAHRRRIEADYFLTLKPEVSARKRAEAEALDARATATLEAIITKLEGTP